MVEAFSFFLHDYEIKDIIRAVGLYVLSCPDIPAPSDIRKILKPQKKEWRPDWDYYRSLKQTLKDGGAYALSEGERSYISACESYSLGQLKEYKNG